MTYNVTEHFAGMTEAERNATVVYVERAKLYATPGRAAWYAWKYSYSYSVNGYPAVGYGPGLADLRNMLRRNLGRKALIIELWKGEQ